MGGNTTWESVAEIFFKNLPGDITFSTIVVLYLQICFVGFHS